ncbi:MAG: hypothetical protein JJE04_11780 [Acidobacteriia bacterium]|nr:hypothetical protein [Terriglobia bacterium]
MASTPRVPPQIDDLGDRLFSFFPPIVNIEHNQWNFLQGNWSEILVRNAKTHTEVWIPRGYLGEFSKVDEPVMILGLKREIEYKSGSVWPYVRRVLPMPSSSTVARGSPEEQPARKPASVVADAIAMLRSSGSGTESGLGKMIGIALLIGIAITVIGIAVLRLRSTGGTVEYRAVVQADLGFSTQSDYFDIVRKLGKPEKDHWKSDAGERQYRALHYPKNDLIVILMGADRESAHYIGAKDGQWRNIHTVEMPGGQKTDSILRTLKRF